MRAFAIVVMLGGIATVALPSTPAHAGVKEQAAAAYGEGVEAFKANDFKTALGHFDRAFKLDPSPILLYNIARCHEEMGTLDPAISNFKLYLAKAPDSPDREDVERRIRVMEAIKKRQAAAAPDVPPAAPTTVFVEDDSMQWWGYGLLGAGAVGLALGGGFGVAADSAAEEHRNATTRSDKSAFEDDANSNATIANASYVIGGVLALAGASIIIWDLATSGTTSVEVAPVPAAGGGGVSIRATF